MSGLTDGEIEGLRADLLHNAHSLKHGIPIDPSDINALCDAALASRSGGMVSIKMLVNMLEASAANTDTDWRWQTATALRQHPHWETATIPLAASGGKG
jgi:hypothetical protein